MICKNCKKDKVVYASGMEELFCKACGKIQEHNKKKFLCILGLHKKEYFVEKIEQDSVRTVTACSRCNKIINISYTTSINIYST